MNFKYNNEPCLIFVLTGKKNKKHKKKNLFTEGWVEFLKKRVAKEVALNLNNTQIGGKKSGKYYDYLWNIKYLPR